jgi:hypothetical protein
MIAARVTPKTMGWPDRCRTWFYAHGGKLDPKIGEIIEQESLKEASNALLKAIEEARTGAFQPEKENDELTRALKNTCVVLWVEGFVDWNDTYRSRARKKKQDADRLQKVESKNAELERAFMWQQEQIDTLSQQRASQWQEQPDTALVSTIPSMPKSSVGSTGSRPMMHCWLATPWMISKRRQLVSCT